MIISATPWHWFRSPPHDGGHDQPWRYDCAVWPVIDPQKKDQEGIMMDSSDLAAFQHLLQGFSYMATPPDLNRCYIAHLYAVEDVFQSLERVDEMLGILLRRFSLEDLEEQINAIFGTTERDWAKAESELSALAYLDERKALHDIGYPKTGSSTPPFEGRLHLASKLVPFDIKSASGSGDALLRSLFNELASDWAQSNNLGKIECEYQTTGTITQPVIGPLSRSLQQKLQSELTPLTTFPTCPIELQQGDLGIRLTIRAATGIVCSGGVAGVTPQARSLAGTIMGHVQSKGNRADSLNEPFFLFYTRGFGCGHSDWTPYGFGKALDLVESNTLFTSNPVASRCLAIGLIDWTPSATPQAYIRSRQVTHWPSVMTPNMLADALNAKRFPN